MMRENDKYFSSFLITFATVTLINILLMYWIPICMPFCSFSAVRMAFVAFVEKRYFLLLISSLICITLILAAISVRRQHVLFPLLSLVYLTYDAIMVAIPLIDGLKDGYWKMYAIQLTIVVVLIVFLCTYCLSCLQKPKTP